MYKNGRPLLSSIRRKDSNLGCGFSLIELMICVSIFIILGLYSAGAYTQKINENRVDSTAKRLIHHLALARLEAVRQGYPVTLCPGVASEGCKIGNGWQGGWVAFGDPNQNYILDPDERPILAGAASLGVTIGWRTPDRLLFKPNGSVWPNGHFRICDMTAKNQRAVIVYLTGRVRFSVQAPGNKSVRCA